MADEDVFWHELALALGMSMAEAKLRISHREFVGWVSYFRTYGYQSSTKSLVPQIQHGFALLASILINVNGGYKDGRKAAIQDFLPERESESQSGEATAAQVASLLGSLNRIPGKGRKLWKRKQRT